MPSLHLTNGRSVALPAFNRLGRNARHAPTPTFAATSETLRAACIPVEENPSPSVHASPAPRRAGARGKDRYRAPVCGSFLPRLVEAMEDAGYLTFTVGTKAVDAEDRVPSTVAPSAHLVSLFGARAVSLSDIRREPGEELVLLKADKDEAERNGELLDYVDGELSEGYRREVRALNAWLASADIAYTSPEPVCVRDRHLVRRFTCGDVSFMSGGRLWGGFWQGLSKRQRHEGLRIGGERVVGIDFREMVLRTVYAMHSLVPPEDGYTLTGEAAKVPRKAVKRIVSAMLFHKKGKRLAAWPGSTVEEREALRQQCNGVKLSTIQKAIEAKHPAIRRYFYTGIGHVTQYRESEIMLAVLRKLRDRGIVALPVHDCAYVPASRETEAVQIMAATWESLFPLPARLAVEAFINGEVADYPAWNQFHLTAAERASASQVSDADEVPPPIASDIREPPCLDAEDPTIGKSREQVRAMVDAFLDAEGYLPPWMPRWLT
jgi:hypothetical protein